jgi:hypothetical protein
MSWDETSAADAQPAKRKKTDKRAGDGRGEQEGERTREDSECSTS